MPSGSGSGSALPGSQCTPTAEPLDSHAGAAGKATTSKQRPPGGDGCNGRHIGQWHHDQGARGGHGEEAHGAIEGAALQCKWMWEEMVNSMWSGEVKLAQCSM